MKVREVTQIIFITSLWQQSEQTCRKLEKIAVRQRTLLPSIVETACQKLISAI
jgi:hypothetical protein